MVTTTTNLKLNKPDGKDVVDISVLNANMDILDEAVPSKVDKVAGKQLSTEDYTTVEKTKLAGIADGAQVNVIEGVTVNGSAVPVTGKTADVAVPTKVSDLTNDADYAKTSQIPTKVSTLQNDAGYAKTADVPKDTKDLTNNAGFITKAVADLANYYVKTDTYTRSEVLELVNAIPKFTVTVVNELPASGDQATIYFVPVEGKGQNVHDEYIWVNNAWEQIGSTAFELDITQDASGIKINGTALQGASATQDGLLTKGAYATFAGKQDAGDYATSEELTAGLAGKADKSEIPDISGKADKSEIPDISGKLDKSGGTLTGPVTLAEGDGSGILIPPNGTVNDTAGGTLFGLLGGNFQVGYSSYPTILRGAGIHPETPIYINGGDGQGLLIPLDGNINVEGTSNTVLGFLGSSFTIGNGAYGLNVRGSGARPQYNSADLAMLSDVPDISNKADKSEIPDISGLATKGEVQTAQSKADSAYDLANGKASQSDLTALTNRVTALENIPNANGRSY